MPKRSPEPPVIALDRALDTDLVRRIVRERLAPHVGPYLIEQRWFGDKDRPLNEVSVTDVAVEAAAPGWFVLATARVTFADGSAAADYLLLAAVVPAVGVAAGDTLVQVSTPAGSWSVADIAAAPGFPAWWLNQFAADAGLAGTHGRFTWRQLAGLATLARAAGPGTLLLGGMGQSNTTVRYNEALFGKIFRRLRSGINPDEEISRFLAEETSFRHVAMPFGSASYEADGGAVSPIGVLFNFIPSVGEGWGWTQDFLATVPLASYADIARGLGERTGQLHLALSSVPAHPDFAPEPATAADIAHWEDATTAGLHAITADLRDQLPTLAPAVQRTVGLMLERQQATLARITGFRALHGTVKTRVHGDYHLGQLLRTPEADWVLLDFEGEPARPIAQRRAKMSPIKDVADMLHSFGYARAMAARSATASQAQLAGWEQEARTSFLGGYRAAVAASPAALIPADDAAFERAVAAWEMAKAIYQVRYELGNRPDWLDVSLSPFIDRGEPAAH